MPLQDRGYTGALETTQQQRRPSALTSAFAAAAACCSPSEQRRPMSLLSMQLRDSSRSVKCTFLSLQVCNNKKCLSWLGIFASLSGQVPY